MSTAEPVIGVFAVRTFRVSVNGYLVPATQYSNDWATGAAIARCSRSHPAPADDCTCGLYSMNNIHQLRTQYKQARRVLAVIALEGQTIQGSKGWRSQAARVIDLWTAPHAVPATQLAQLKAHLPEVRFHTDENEMLARYPELQPDPAPRRTALTVACRGTRDRVRNTRVTRTVAVGWAALTAVLVAVLALVSGPRFTPGVWTELMSITLAGVAVACVLGEAPGQLIVLLLRGGMMPLVLAPWRPVKHLFRTGSSLLAAGIITSTLFGYPVDITGTLVALAVWVVLLLTETFLCALHRCTRPTPLPALIGLRPAGHRATRTGWEPARPAGGRPRFELHPLRRTGLTPITINPSTGR